MTPTTGYAPINGAQLYYELRGDGPAFVMLHAGIADHTLWDAQAAHFAARYRILRYDMRCFGKSEPVAGDFSHLEDLAALLSHHQIAPPAILMGCSMGGGIALDYTLAHPDRVRALIMVCSGPGGLEIDVPSPPGYAAAVAAWNAGDLATVNEYEIGVWVAGRGRTLDQIDAGLRDHMLKLNARALELEKRGLGKEKAAPTPPAYQRLHELNLPVLVIAGALDTAYMEKATQYMAEHIPGVRVIIMPDTAHVPSLERPAAFNHHVESFLSTLE